MNLKTTPPGYILVVTVLMIFAMSFLITRVMHKAFSAVHYNAMTSEREQAKTLALDGIAIVQAQLVHAETKDTKPEELKKWYQKFALLLNQWQTVTLTQKVDGLEGTIQTFAVSEEGKLPLNALWDFKNKKFKVQNGQDMRTLLDHVILKREGKKNEERKIVDELESFLKKQDEPLEDLSELLVSDYFRGLVSTFYPSPPATPGQSATQTASLSLTDIFTVAHNNASVQPLFLSASVKEIFEFKQLPRDAKEQEEIIKSVVNAIKGPIDWKKDWDSLVGKIYGKTYQQLLPALPLLFTPMIGDSLISVVSYGKTGTTTQKVYALLQKVISSDKEQKNNVTYVVRKLYWLA